MTETSTRPLAIKAAGESDVDKRIGPYSARLLVAALEAEANRRRHTSRTLAVALGVHPAHWYRLRATPKLLARCARPTLESIAVYLKWPLSQVLLASGAIGLDELEALLGGGDVVSETLAQLESSPLGAALTSPLASASRDHQLLIAELYAALQVERVRCARLQASGGGVA
jgi:hypothetical protein